MTLDTPKSVIFACPFLSTKILPWDKRLFARVFFFLKWEVERLCTYPLEVPVDDGRFEVVQIRYS